MNKFELLSWDSEFFGFKVASILLSGDSIYYLSNALNELKLQGVKLAYWKTNPADTQAQLLAQKFGGLLVDAKTTYGMPVIKTSAINSNIESYKSSEVSDIMYSLALQTGEYSRFKVDKNIGNEHFTALYHKWIENSIARKNASEVFVYKLNNQIAGLITLSESDAGGSIGLIGVDKNVRGQGIGQKLVKASHQYFSSKNIDYMTVVTQKANIPACRFYEICGFKIIKVENVYHFWL
jgi:dTDP-4-amino-4,6-dideoxy-D-galactose acyltransferase